MSSRIVRSWCVRQPACSEPLDRDERVAGADLRDGAAVEELQELDDELDVADAAAARLHVPLGDAGVLGVLLDAPLEALDAGDVGEAEIAAVNPGPQLVEVLLAQLDVAGDGAGLDVRLPLPGAAAGVVVGQRLVDARARAAPAGRRAAAACRRGRRSPGRSAR